MSLFRLTLYELFGYLVPGLFCFLSVALLGWTGFTLDLGLHGSVHLSAIQCVAFLLISYILGASVHSLAEWLYGSRWICRVGPATVFSRGTGGVHRELLEKLEEVIERRFLVRVQGLGDRWKWRICEESLFLSGHWSQQERYQYRMGFYRTMSVVFLIVGLCIVAQSLVLNLAIRFGGERVVLPRLVSVLGGLFLLLLAFLSRWQYERYFRFRLESALLGLVVLEHLGALRSSSVNDTQEDGSA